MTLGVRKLKTPTAGTRLGIFWHLPLGVVRPEGFEPPT